MAKIFIDDKAYEVEEGKNLLEVCLSLGLNLTYFCWHPALHSVGACRQCAVINYKDENDTRGKLVMACMQPATDNTRISIEAPKAREFRAGNIEALMINHPHDCPVCDEGGECHLQDMTVMSGHNYRRYRFNKRTHKNQYLGPFIHHEMNRCIQCYRCVRYYNDYADGKDLSVFAAHDSVYFGRHEDGVLESEFSGNLVEVCPTGVFTDKTLRQHYTRKWDLTASPSVCHQCSVGCNLITGERYGTIRRTLSRYNGDVNGYFLCDRGRFGYEYTSSKRRILFPQKKEQGQQQQIEKDIALEEIKSLIAGDKKIMGIGSPRASLESNFLLRKLVGETNFYGGVPNREGNLVRQIIRILKDGKVRTPSLKETESFDTVFILGEDVTNTAPMLALSLRQAAKNKPRQKALDMKVPAWNDAAIREIVQGAKGPFYIAATHSTKLDEIATQTYYAAPGDIARFAYAVAHEINNSLPEITGLDEATSSLARSVAGALLAAKKPLIVSGTSLFSDALIQAAADLAFALKDQNAETGLVYAVPEANSMGLAMLSDQFLEEALEKAEKDKVETLIILENDLYYRIDDNRTTRFFQNAEHTVVLENLHNATTQRADYILPAGTFAESDGTIVNNEGRAQRFYQTFVPENDIKSSWAWLDKLEVQNREEAHHFDAIVDEMISAFPDLAPVRSVAPPADFRVGTQKIPREPHRYSGRTAMRANINVSEPKPPSDPDSPLSFTMEGYHGVPPSPDIPFFWSPGWNSAQAINKYQIEVGGPLHGGNPGKRLLEPSGESSTTFFNAVPSAFSAKEGEWFVIPYYYIFGSDELSAHGPAIAERIPKAHFMMNKEDAERMGFAENDKIEIAFDQGKITLPVKIDHSLKKGTAGLPKGFKETAGLQFPFWTKLKAKG